MEIWEEIYNRLLCLIVMINSEINYSCEFLSLIDTANKIFIISLCVCVLIFCTGIIIIIVILSC